MSRADLIENAVRGIQEHIQHIPAEHALAAGSLVVAAYLLVRGAKSPLLRDMYLKMARRQRYCGGCRWYGGPVSNPCELGLDRGERCGLLDARTPLPTGVKITRAPVDAPPERGEPGFSCTVSSTPLPVRQRIGHGNANASIALAEIASRTTGQPVDLVAHGERTKVGEKEGETELF